ncbi:MAG: hypothetical protein WAL52_05575 [Candidatus Sulfotelmatobacter sp.]
MDPTYSTAQQVKLGGLPYPKLQLKDIYALYGSRFGCWFGITAPTSLLASVVLLMADRRIHTIYRSIPRGEIPYHLAQIAEAGVVRYGSFFAAWFLGCFALAAIATVINGLDNYDDAEVWTSDRYRRARERFGPLLRAAFLTFLAFLTGMAIVVFVYLSLLRSLGRGNFLRFSYGASFIGMLIVASIVSCLGMAIPRVLSSNVGAWAALKSSIKLSKGYEQLLSLLVLESTVGSLVAWYATRFGLALLVPPHIRFTAEYGWFVDLVAVFASAAVQPPMFIGFSLLASDRNANLQTLPDFPEQAQAH